VELFYNKDINIEHNQQAFPSVGSTRRPPKTPSHSGCGWFVKLVSTEAVGAGEET
jgi:hypothetical protein